MYSNLHSALRKAVGACLLVSSCCGYAQTPVPDEDALFAPIPKVETASRFSQRTDEAPSSVTIVSARDIETYGYRTLGDILNSVRGFTVSGDRNYTYLGARGFARTGDYNSRFLFLLDGRRMNDNLYGDVGLGEDGVIDVALIDRVEIVRGPSSSLYGASAFLGVINIITKRGRDLEGGELAAGAGSEHSLSVRGAWGAQPDAGHEFLVSASAYGSRGAPRLYYSAFDAAATNFGVAENADGERAQRLFGKLRLGHLEFEGALVDRTKHVPTGSFGTVFNDNRTVTRDRRVFLEARHEAEISPATMLRSRFSWNANYSDGDYVYDRGAGPYINKDYSRGTWWTAELAAVTRIGTAHRLAYGAEYQKDQRLEQGNYDTAVYLSDRRKAQNSALYVQDEWRVAGAIVNVGLRYDHYTTFGSTTSPRIGLILPVRDGTTVKLLSGKAFRVPNAYELYYSDGNQTQMANPDLRPETILTREAVLEQRLAGGWRLSASAYEYEISNLIRQTTDPASGLLVFGNLSHVSTSGVEFELAGRLWRQLDAVAGFTVQKTHDERTGATLVNSPHRVGKLQLSLPLMDRHARAGVTMRYLSERTTEAGNRIPDSLILDLNLRAKLGTAGTTLVFSAFNLFDRPYADPGAREHTQDTIPQAGRTVWLTLEQRL